jgi:hypothetical protein
MIEALWKVWNLIQSMNNFSGYFDIEWCMELEHGTYRRVKKDWRGEHFWIELYGRDFSFHNLSWALR